MNKNNKLENCLSKKNKKELYNFIKLTRFKMIIECFILLIVFNELFVETKIAGILLCVCFIILASSWVAVALMLLKNEVKI